ncbi:hypothetical protein I5M27_09850 [Adhaeribacter sp. BT258]|uniref:Outer membrane lipoprotein-sorting protein n=1 Tax=Adhaeribacter terrigena TaxID=2793070 RepID=A0ABS1C1R9_9BACT|nr:hypothetical protein [Adhaeribacter terrigena]MBK0403289.1 hypothetical protein [Adhaeribacter terrigena]
MIHSQLRRKPVRMLQLLSIFSFLFLAGCNGGGSKEVYPAQPGFNEEGSDKKALEIADKMMEALGGYDAWQNTRYIAWTFFGQYNIWDKKESLFRHEKGNVVSVLAMSKGGGRVFDKGVEETDTVQLYNKLSTAYTHFVSNTYFLFMPYKMKDQGVTLKYRFEAKGPNGKPADVLRLTFDRVGISPDNMHDVWIDKETHLPVLWAFYGSKEDKEPAFIRKWADYKDFNGMKLAVNRDSQMDTLRISHLKVVKSVPKALFLSPTPIDKSQIK